MTSSVVDSPLAKRNRAQVILAITSPLNRHVTGEEVHHPPTEDECVDHFVRHAADKYALWYNLVTDTERELMDNSMKSEQELLELVRSGKVRDLVGWFSTPH